MATVMATVSRVRKPTRRYATGAVYQRADGMWVGSIEAGITAEGQRRRIVVSAKTAKACEGKLDRKRAEIARDGIPDEDVLARTTVRIYAAEWLERRVRALRPKTVATYRSALRRSIIPAIGKRRLSVLTPADVRAVARAVIDDTGSSTTALHAHRVLMAMLRDAKRDGHAVPERVLLTKGPIKAVNDRSAIPLADALAILKVTDSEADATRWLVALLQGMRQGECLGLTWDCVDLDGGLIDVSWQLQELPYAHGCSGRCGRKTGGRCPDRYLATPDGYEYRQLSGAQCLVRPKTASGQRVIPMVPGLAARLKGWRTIAPASPHDLVWPDASGQPRLGRDDTASWRALQDRAGVRHPSGRYYTTHEIRHSTATLLLQAGVDPHTVTAILGHSSIVTSRGYQHVDQTLARQAIAAVATQLGLAE